MYRFTTSSYFVLTFYAKGVIGNQLDVDIDKVGLLKELSSLIYFQPDNVTLFVENNYLHICVTKTGEHDEKENKK